MAAVVADPDRPTTWVPYRDTLCEGCRAGCCRLPVEVTPADLVRLGAITAEDAHGSLKRIARHLQEEGYIQAFHPQSGSFTLRQEEGACIFLGADRRCTVYERRPDICRQFPAVGARPGYCPSSRA